MEVSMFLVIKQINPYDRTNTLKLDHLKLYLK